MKADHDKNDLTLKYSHNIIEHLGLKLYQNKPTNVIAELVSNSWDAEASNVSIEVSSNTDAHQVISVVDDGYGMSLEELKENYLIIGKKKKADRKPEDGKRTPMGRKGIGKLAPFGIANEVIVITVKDSYVNSFKLNYSDMIQSNKNSEGISLYKPIQILKNSKVSECLLDLKKYNQELLNKEKLSENILDKMNNFLEQVSTNSHSGTMILCTDINLRKTISPNVLRASLGKRFTIILNRPDFKVHVNGTEITESQCFPEWAIRVPETGNSKHSLTLSNGETVTVSYWAAFVDKADWPTDQAGVGVYAHGKIAQDRPFTFGVKGNEIFTRYMYAVIEADWIDEFAEDEISTDRTSINWDNEIFDSFYEWGAEQVKKWIKEYKEFKQKKAFTENNETIEEVILEKGLSIKQSEKDHVNKIISEITPNMTPDVEQKNRLIEATLKAWTHEPARNLIKKLWNATSNVNSDDFANLIFKLEDELVPESLSLAVMFSQRVYALTKLEQNIQLKKETHLQILIETFPWILGNDYEKFISRMSLKNIVIKATEDGVFPIPQHIPQEANDKKQPDFVFLSDSSDENILVVELKGPEITAEWSEFQQIRNYMDYLQSRYPASYVTGMLIAGGFNEGITKQKPVTLEFCTWDLILRKSRKEHMKYLIALLDGSEADASDMRVKQVCELGGPVVVDFIKKMSATSEPLSRLIKQIEHQETKRVRTTKPS